MRFVCAMILVFVAFAHKPNTVSAANAPELALYVLPDGTLPSLCLPDQENKQGKHLDHGCEACRIGASATVPLPSIAGEDIARDARLVVFLFAPEAVHRLNFPPNAPPRGPPADLLSFETA